MNQFLCEDCGHVELDDGQECSVCGNTRLVNIRNTTNKYKDEEI